jgi:hypothetical protein
MKTRSALNTINEVTPISTVEEVKEKISLTKSERFKKYAGGRTAQALRAIENLGNCANTTNYEYTEHQVSTMFTELKRVLTETEAKFQPKARQKFGRNFFQEEGE